MTLAVRKLCGSWFIKLSFGEKRYITFLSPKNVDVSLYRLHARPWTHPGQVVSSQSTRTSAPRSLISNLNDSFQEIRLRRSIFKDPAAPNPALVCWNFKKAQRAQTLGCLSPHCLLNHWGTIGLSMHEKVLSASTLQRALKKNHSTSDQVWLRWIRLQEDECTSASFEGASVSQWSDSLQHTNIIPAPLFQRASLLYPSSLPHIPMSHAHCFVFVGIGSPLLGAGGQSWPLLTTPPPLQPPLIMLCLHLWLKENVSLSKQIVFQLCSVIL